MLDTLRSYVGEPLPEPEDIGEWGPGSRGRGRAWLTALWAWRCGRWALVPPTYVGSSPLSKPGRTWRGFVGPRPEGPCVAAAAAAAAEQEVEHVFEGILDAYEKQQEQGKGGQQSTTAIPTFFKAVRLGAGAAQAALCGLVNAAGRGLRGCCFVQAWTNPPALTSTNTFCVDRAPPPVPRGLRVVLHVAWYVQKPKTDSLQSRMKKAARERKQQVRLGSRPC